MAPLKYLACAAVAVGSSFVYRQVEGAAVTAKGATSDCLLAMNLLRTGRLSQRLPLLVNDSATETTATTAITTGNLAGTDNTSCTLAGSTTPVSASVGGVLLTYPQAEQLDCVGLVQNFLTNAISKLPDYKGEKWDNGAAAPYNDSAVQNLAYATFANAGKLGCGVTDNCAAGTNVLVCKFAPSLSSAFTEAPFTLEFFKALKSRQDAKVNLADLTDKDLDTSPLGSGSGVPGVLPAAGLVVATLLGLISSHV